MQKYNKYKKLYERDQVTVESVDNLYRKTLQDNVFDENEYESLCFFLLNIWMNQKMNFFYKHEHKDKINLS